MDALLSKVTYHAMNYAIKSGISITSGFAISQCTRLLKTKDGREREELQRLQIRLESKIRIISPAIDMIELITARGNTSLESAVTLTKTLRWDIQNLGVRLSRAVADEELARSASSEAKSKPQLEFEIRQIINDMRSLLDRIEDAVPLINLAITTSGVSLSTSLPASVSPSRLLQASTFLTAGDAQYASNPRKAAQIGPEFTLSMYMLFSGHTQPHYDAEGLRDATWKEVMHKARVKLVRTSISHIRDFPVEDLNEKKTACDSAVMQSSGESTIPSDAHSEEYAYQLLLIEDLNDDRVHTFEDEEVRPGFFLDVDLAGVREVLPIHEVSKIFYADTGKILNIGSDSDVHNPVLLLKRDLKATPPRRMMYSEYDIDDTDDDQYPSAAGVQLENELVDEASEIEAQFTREASEQPESNAVKTTMKDPWRLPPDLDPEWIALEVYEEDPESDTESEATEDKQSTETHSTTPSQQGSVDPQLSSALEKLRLSPAPSPISESRGNTTPTFFGTPQKSNPISQMFGQGPSVRTSLSLLEMLVRLTSLQQFQQASHLTINDELLNFFLQESSTTGAAPGDIEARKRIRMDARRRVGFDPYDESPIKFRGEDYQYQQAQSEHNDTWAREDNPSWTPDRSQNNTSRTPYLLPGKERFSRSASGTPDPRHHAMSSPIRRTPNSAQNRNRSRSVASSPGTGKPGHAHTTSRSPRADKFRGSPLAKCESLPSVPSKVQNNKPS